ncbi:DUF2716 domain-containing protein [Bacillus inaquosorum]|uniref:DUF2716 domain-containing protein n=1 Tax=Bacillus inaquosorum TaxID=483913 RepID=UPI00228177A3|nr:DUF2716 domain-containing protein [Bacillus inaquosorum]MCY8070078.1 DUF2716 domain-containing protein [Bacillus inaquosorum]MCY8492263.1 DUF2716 domain-containing protein [Bacillus inaquosorum]MCY8695495.1 DUF2716 domain-containing protein [Bacillus inaquosorum]MCY9378161.1 DUF2716 domain-containing protein [Bacillus inaquosorum]
MVNWRALSQTKQDRIWSEVNQLIKWMPGSRFHHIIPPDPYRVFDISSVSHNDVSGVLSDLETSILKAFQSCTGEQDVIYAFDWQHDGYIFSPHQTMPKDEFGEWPVPVFPNGDYYFFFHQDFSWGLLGDPWKCTITVFGEELLEAVDNYPPILFHISTSKRR